MAEPLSIDNQYRNQFTDSMRLVTQQMGSRLRPYVTETPCTSEAQVAENLLKEGDYVKQSGRSRTNVETPLETGRRWHIIPDYLKTGEYLDTEDKFRAMTDARSQRMMGHAAKIRRGVDDIIIGVEKVTTGGFKVTGGGLLGKAAEGKSPGSGTTALPASQKIAANATGLTLDKLKQVYEGLAASDYDLDMENPVMAISPKQNTNMVDFVENASAGSDLVNNSVIRSGRLRHLMGIDFVMINRLPTDSNGDRLCPVWMPQNIDLGIWSDVEPRAWNDTHADNLPYINVRVRMDCVRIEDKGVYEVACVEA